MTIYIQAEVNQKKKKINFYANSFSTESSLFIMESES